MFAEPYETFGHRGDDGQLSDSGLSSIPRKDIGIRTNGEDSHG